MALLELGRSTKASRVQAPSPAPAPPSCLPCSYLCCRPGGPAALAAAVEAFACRAAAAGAGAAAAAAAVRLSGAAYEALSRQLQREQQRGAQAPPAWGSLAPALAFLSAATRLASLVDAQTEQGALEYACALCRQELLLPTQMRAVVLTVVAEVGGAGPCATAISNDLCCAISARDSFN